MKTLIFPISLLIFVVLPFISCAVVPSGRIDPVTPEPLPPGVILVRPAVPSYIMSVGMVSAENMALFLLQNNPSLDPAFAYEISVIYTEEAAFEGVNHDIAFVQMILETGFLRFGGDVRPEQNNFGGLGAIGGGEPGLAFESTRIGVRAQVQHLKAYGCVEPLNGELVMPLNGPPRFRFVRRGIAPTFDGLTGTWAMDPYYADKIRAILERLYEFSFGA